MHNGSAPMIAAILLPLIVLALVLISVFFIRSKGYPKGGGKNVIVRCSKGHLFTTIWIPLMSIKAIRLGPYRFQFCPVGRHWAMVIIVDPSTLSKRERETAMSNHDAQIP